MPDQKPAALAAPGKWPRLAALIGVSAAALLAGDLTSDEGWVLRGYRDPIGIPTKCAGDTEGVVVGRAYSVAECEASLDRQAAAKVAAVLACTPALKGHPQQLRAATRLAYNIGSGAFCASTIAKRFRAHRWRAACDGFPAWSRAGGKVLPGLVARRARERAICLTDLPA